MYYINIQSYGDILATARYDDLEEARAKIVGLVDTFSEGGILEITEAINELFEEYKEQREYMFMIDLGPFDLLLLKSSAEYASVLNN